MRNLTLQEVIYRCGRWLLKEIPRDTIKILQGKGSPIDLIKMPIDLFNFYARSKGQKTAKLSEKAQEIHWL